MSGEVLVCKPALAAFTFVAAPGGRGGADPARAAGAASYLRAIWDGLEGIGIREAIGQTPTSLPDAVVDRATGTGSEEEFQLLARKRGSGGGPGVYEAKAFRQHDVVGIGILLASEEEQATPDRWSGLLDQWLEVAGSHPTPDGLLGTTLLFTGLEAHPIRDAPPEGFAPPPLPTPMAEASTPFRSMDGFVLWGAPLNDSPRAVGLLAPVERETLLEGWAWAAGLQLPRLAAYFLNASKVRHELQVYARLRGQIEGGRAEVDARAEEALGLARTTPSRQYRDLDALLEAQDRLADAQASSSGLLVALTTLRELERTAGIARFNMLAERPAPAAGWEPPSTSFFERDDERVRWLATQISHDVAYGEAVSERAREVQALAQVRLQHATEHRARRRERLALIQTSLAAAIATAFVARFDSLGGVLAAPVVAVGVSLAIALPFLFVNWHEGYRGFDLVVGCLLGTSLGWLAGALIYRAFPAHHATLAVLVGAVVGLLLATAFTWQVIWRRRAGPTR